MPCMDWTSANFGEAFELFRKCTQLYFSMNNIAGDKQIEHILLLSGEEGLRRRTLCDLGNADGTRPNTVMPGIVWQCFKAELKPQANFRVACLCLQ